MNILSKEEIRDILFAHYKENYGVEYGDVWYETDGINVASFGRGDKIITLKCHILKGNVTEHIRVVRSKENQQNGRNIK